MSSEPASLQPPPAQQVRHLSPNWHLSAEGQGVAAHLLDQETGQRRLFGALERPMLPPTVATIPLKVFLCGRAGVGKSCLVSFLCGRPPCSSAETPGLRVTELYWPAKVIVDSRIVLFKISLWDAGDAAGRKYGHVNPACRQDAAGGIFVFSFTDRGSLEEVESQLSRIAQAGKTAAGFCPLVVGTRFGSLNDSEISNQDVLQFEAKWRLPVIKVRHFGNQQQQQQRPSQNEVAAVLNAMVERLWVHRQRQQAAIDPSLI